MGFGLLITAVLDQSAADPIQLCAHIADHPISLSCHPCVDRSGSRSIPRLRTAKDEGASKDTRRPSRHRSADSSSGELSAQSESSTQRPCTEEHDEQDIERPNRQPRLRRVHPPIRDPEVLVEVTQSLVTLSLSFQDPCLWRGFLFIGMTLNVIALTV